jgi:basic membrane protein A
MKKPWYILSCLIGILPFIAACSSDDDEDVEPSTTRPSLTYVTSVSGLGDNGYNDLIMQGVMTFAETHPEVEVNLRMPSSTSEAQQMLEEWQRNTLNETTSEHLLLLGESAYASLVKAASTPLAEHQRVLLVESDSLESRLGQVSTLHIRRYGAAYLVGCLARETQYAYVLAAYEGDTIVRDAVRGFCDGYRDAGGKTAEVHYLAQDASGYAMSNESYRWLKDLGDSSSGGLGVVDAFVFPVAGGSNNGVYKYTRDMVVSLLLVCGMDVDASAYSVRVPCSMVLHLDLLVNRLLTQWLVCGELPAHTEVGLDDPEAIEVVATPTFWYNAIAYQDYYSDPDFWSDAIREYYSTALAKERAYETEH